MVDTYFNKEETTKTLVEYFLCSHISESFIKAVVDQIPAADVVPAEDYKHLLKIANKMHLWIFMHTGDEQAAYDECGLTDEDNAMLGYGGQYILSLGEEDEFVQ